MYPNQVLWLYNGEVTNCNRGNPLPLKLYKYYLSKNIEYTHYKNIDDEVYDTYNEIPEPEYYIGSIRV